MMTFGLPVLVLGGGGYRINNVARCWAYETGRILGEAFTTLADSACAAILSQLSWHNLEASLPQIQKCALRGRQSITQQSTRPDVFTVGS